MANNIISLQDYIAKKNTLQTNSLSEHDIIEYSLEYKPGLFRANAKAKKFRKEIEEFCRLHDMEFHIYESKLNDLRITLPVFNVTVIGQKKLVENLQKRLRESFWKRG